ncbi:MAG: hypothetical protein VYA69_14465, partial [Gemmatimonadota bacterium]|nr:hypothetical protein [Gemmatimonadota bacterium]
MADSTRTDQEPSQLDLLIAVDGSGDATQKNGGVTKAPAESVEAAGQENGASSKNGSSEPKQRKSAANGRSKYTYDESKVTTLSSLEHIRLRTGM